MPVVKVTDYAYPGGWTEGTDPAARASEYCRALEKGNVLAFDGVPYQLSQADLEFLRSQRQSTSRFHKNISYRPATDTVRGFETGAEEEKNRLQEIMRNFSHQTVDLVTALLAPYAPHMRLDYASYRPFEEEGRDLPLKKRNDLLHVDSFPTRPTRGSRILRVFTNISTEQPRKWRTTPPFSELFPQFAADESLRRILQGYEGPLAGLKRTLLRTGSAAGLPMVDRPPYDALMLRLHDLLKEDAGFQKESPAENHDFQPMTTWMVYTDGVGHAVMSGKYALEQTFLIPPEAWVAPEEAPIRVLEKHYGRELSV